MKLLIVHAVGFAMMTTICFMAISAIVLFMPFMIAFIFWDWSVLNFGWPLTFLWARLILTFSSGIGLWFTLSKEGRGAALEFMGE